MGKEKTGVIQGQVRFAGNGNVMPCPYTDSCITYQTGCKGVSYWCGRFDTSEDRRTEKKFKERWQKRRLKNDTCR